MNTAHWNIEGGPAQAVPELFRLGALFAVPPGQSVVEGGTIPYLPEALEQRNKNRASWPAADPETKCYRAGIPRSTYMPYPFQIVQTPANVLFAYEFASASRIVYMNSTDESPAESWMGFSRGRWDGDTLVVDVTSFNEDTWFDRAGNFHSADLHVVERYTRTGPDVLQYEATIEDPKVFTRPWTIRMPLYRRLEKNAQLLEYKCVEFVEELMYGQWRKNPLPRFEEPK